MVKPVPGTPGVAVRAAYRVGDTPHSDADLLAAIRSGDEAAFEAVFREHYGRLCLYASRMLNCDATAEDIVQDALMRVWQTRERLTVNGRLARYLSGAVRNGVLMHMRRARCHRGWKEQTAAGCATPLMGQRPPQPDEWIRSSELIRAIHDAIQKLPPRCREAFLLRWECHLSYEEIAEVMGIKRKTVEVQISAALRALHLHLADWRD